MKKAHLKPTWPEDQLGKHLNGHEVTYIIIEDPIPDTNEEKYKQFREAFIKQIAEPLKTSIVLSKSGISFDDLLNMQTSGR